MDDELNWEVVEDVKSTSDCSESDLACECSHNSSNLNESLKLRQPIDSTFEKRNKALETEKQEESENSKEFDDQNQKNSKGIFTFFQSTTTKVERVKDVKAIDNNKTQNEEAIQEKVEDLIEQNQKTKEEKLKLKKNDSSHDNHIYDNEEEKDIILVSENPKNTKLSMPEKKSDVVETSRMELNKFEDTKKKYSFKIIKRILLNVLLILVGMVITNNDCDFYRRWFGHQLNFKNKDCKKRSSHQHCSKKTTSYCKTSSKTCNQGYFKICHEYSSCRVERKGIVRFGSNNSWVYKSLDKAQEFSCTNAFFGKDPLIGVVKSCHFLPDVPYEKNIFMDQDYIKLCDEYNTCSTIGSGKLRYGFDNYWVYKRINKATNFTCLNKFFRKDPVRGQVKSCFFLPDNEEEKLYYLNNEKYLEKINMLKHQIKVLESQIKAQKTKHEKEKGKSTTWSKIYPKKKKNQKKKYKKLQRDEL